MKMQLKRVFFIMVLIISFISPNMVFTNVNTTIQNIALIIDTNEFYDDSFIDDILRGFDNINKTYNINYDVYFLYNYTNINFSPYQAVYYHNNTKTNHTELARVLVEANKYDLIVLVGYELRREFLDFTGYSDTNFMFYDLSGELPSFSGDEIPNNLLVVSCKENEIGFIAGTLTSATISPLPNKIAMVGTHKNDPRSRQLIAGFQSAIFRNHSDILFLITYINDYTNSTKAANIGNNLKADGYELAFAALQNNNSLGFSEGFSEGIVISIDSNRTRSIMKNNTQILTQIFSEIDQNGFIGGNSVIYEFKDNVFFPTAGWGDKDLVNNTMNQIYRDLIVDGSTVPMDIFYASNTPGFEFIFSFIILIGLFFYYNRFSSKKRR